MTIETKNVAEHITASDLFTVKPGEGVDEMLAAWDAYLAPFAKPIVRDGKTFCLGCDAQLDGMMQAIGVAAAYRWDLAHGEARCSGCGWPARGMHYPKKKDGSDLGSIRNFFLAYHPDALTPAEKSDAA